MRRMDLNDLIVRWKKATRALRIEEQHYGGYLTDILEKRTDTELALFKDDVEAATFFCLIDLEKRNAREWSGSPFQQAVQASSLEMFVPSLKS